MSKLGDAQEKFSLMLGKLIIKAYELGYQIRMGEGYDDDGVGHMKGSTHYIKLGQDINLFKNGVYLTDGVDHNILHDYWDSLGGGKRINSDLNHYSLEYEGRR